jgi:hypothetical protein
MGVHRTAPARLRAPFPWFGGKSRANALVWEGLGDVGNYVEPFAGSLAVLLGRPTTPRTETVNDLDCYLACVWRALRADPEAVAAHADWPVNEADLHARHRWLVAQTAFRERMRRDPEFYDVRVAGWWLWGVSMWIGGGWCSTRADDLERGDGTRPSLTHAAPSGEVPSEQAKRPGVGGSRRAGLRGVHRDELRTDERLPKIGGNGQGSDSIGGLHGARYREPAPSEQIPFVGGRGRGVARPDEDELRPAGGAKRPNLGSSSSLGVLGPLARTRLVEEFVALATRLRNVRVCCGDWTRVLTPAVTTGHGLTGVLLDPPYSTKERAAGLYAHDGPDVSGAVREWAVAHGDDPLLRIALCGYEGEHLDMPKSWRVVEWKAQGGFGKQRADKSNQNEHRERIWFSPHCQIAQRGLFA